MKAGQHVGGEAGDYVHDWDRDRGGFVAESGRWWPASWWDGHWLERTRCGEWREAGGSAEVCHRRHSHDGEHTYSRSSLERAKAAAVPDHLLYPTQSGSRQARRRSDRERSSADFKAYLEARYDDAEQDTRGNLVSAAGKKRGITARQFFNGRRRASLRYASDELRDWFEANGRNLTASDYREQAAGGGPYAHLGARA